MDEISEREYYCSMEGVQEILYSEENVQLTKKREAGNKEKRLKRQEENESVKNREYN